MRVILDTNILVTAAINPSGPPAELLVAAEYGSYELIVSPKLLYELEAVITRPWIAVRISAVAAAEFVDHVAAAGTMVLDPRRRAPRSENLDDDYLLALAQITGSVLVTGDKRVHADHPAGVTVLRARELLDRIPD